MSSKRLGVMALALAASAWAEEPADDVTSTVWIDAGALGFSLVSSPSKPEVAIGGVILLTEQFGLSVEGRNRDTPFGFISLVKSWHRTLALGLVTVPVGGGLSGVLVNPEVVLTRFFHELDELFPEGGAADGWETGLGLTLGYQHRVGAVYLAASLRATVNYCWDCSADGVSHPVRLVGQPIARYGLGDVRYSGPTFALELPTVRVGYAF